VPIKPGTNQAYGVADFFVGGTITVSGREFFLTDADDATRRLMRDRYGMEVGPAASIPATYLPDAHIHGHVPHRNKVAPDMNDEEDTVHGFYKRAGDTKAQFMAYGASMLRFECEWRETATPFGDRRSFALQYFLADDTIEILDKTSPYARGGQFTKFIQRQRLPRLPLESGTEAVVPMQAGGGLSSANAMGATDAARAVKEGIVLPDPVHVLAAAKAAAGKYKYSTGVSMRGKFINPITGRSVFEPSTSHEAKQPGAALPGPVTVGGFPVISSLNSDPNYVCASDLICGGVISVYGRPLLVKTCDPFTVAWGLQMLGVDQRKLFIINPTTVAEERAAAMPGMVPRGNVPLPPHIGALAIGSEEETRVNANKIMPTFRSERNFDRFYQLQGKSLRFESRMDPALCDPQDVSREFVVSFYLEDDTLAIVEVHRDKKGVSATRWLSRGKHRNHRGELEDVAGKAVLGGRAPAPLPQEAQDAYDRINNAPGERFGYGDGFGGQGYSGGIYGKSERVGAGGTGVKAPGDLGIRDPMTHAYAAPHRFFKAEDFAVGSVIQLAHAPGQAFILGKPDGFTKHFLEAKAAQAVTDPRDVFVAESKHPVPSLPLEGVSTDAAGHGAVSNQLHEDCLTLGKILAGVLSSVHEVVRQADKADRGYAPVGVVRSSLAKYGVMEPVCPEEVVERVVAAFVVGSGAELAAKERDKENSRSTKKAYRRPTGGSPNVSELEMSHMVNREASMLGDPLTGPHLTDFAKTPFASVQMVDYEAMFDAIRRSALVQQSLQPRLDKLVNQLRTALLSSRTHLRKMFRDLDVSGKGIITFAEFRRLLMRHHLDIGLADAQIRALMARFPQADPAAAEGEKEPALSWMGFIESILDAKTLAPGEIDGFLDFVRGIHDRDAPSGVGGTRVVPENFPHVNRVSHWTPDMDLSRFGIHERPSTATAPVSALRPATAPAAPNTSVANTSVRSAVSAPNTSVVAPPPVPRVGIAPEMTARVSLAPGGGDIRPPPARGTLNVVSALSASSTGRALLDRMRSAFGPKRLDVYRALALYDTMRKRTLNVPSFLSALVSAGLKLTSSQVTGVSASLCEVAAGETGRLPVPQDVHVDYEAFLEDLFA
jgi:hypothetical protein